MRSLLGKALALVYAAIIGIVLYLNIPRALMQIQARPESWAVPVCLLVLTLVAAVVSLPLRGLLHLAGKPCGKFFAICLATLTGAFVTYELTYYVSDGLFAGVVTGGLFVLFGGIFMMAFPIVAIYKYVS